jgi:hypothetical protein
VAKGTRHSAVALLLVVALASACSAQNARTTPTRAARPSAAAVTSMVLSSPPPTQPPASSSPPSAQPPSPAASEQGAALPTFTITLPEGWQKVDMTPAAIDSLLKVVSTTNPQLVGTLQQQLMAAFASGVVYWAMDFRNLTYTSNVMVLEKDVPQGMSLVLIEAIDKAAVADVSGMHLISTALVRPPAGTMLEIRASLKAKDASGNSFTAKEDQFYFLRQTHLYVLTFSCGPTSTTCASDTETMVDSFTPNPQPLLASPTTSGVAPPAPS